MKKFLIASVVAAVLVVSGVELSHAGGRVVYYSPAPVVVYSPYAPVVVPAPPHGRVIWKERGHYKRHHKRHHRGYLLKEVPCYHRGYPAPYVPGPYYQPGFSLSIGLR